MSQYTCVRKVWSDIWHPHVCGKPAKFWIDTGGPTRAPACGVHANKAKREGRKVEPITADEAGAVTEK